MMMAYEPFMKPHPSLSNIYRPTSTTLTLTCAVGSCLVSLLVHLHKLNQTLKKKIDPVAKKEDYINLSSFSIEEGSIPADWPLAALLEPDVAHSLEALSIESATRPQEEGNSSFSNYVFFFSFFFF